MTIEQWQQCEPAVAARELHARAARLSPAQQRAVFSSLLPRESLEAAFTQARAKRVSPLAGTPCVLKDLFDVAGMQTFAGSKFLPQERTVTRDGTLTHDLRGQHGLVIAGKTHLHEFAYGITGENPHYGDCEHPRDPTRTTGGSSSGSAAAVAAGVVPIAFGSDTGGSIRVPAAFCGIFGLRLKPHHRWIEDAFPLARSFDAPGWFTRTAVDLRSTITAFIAPTAAINARGCWLEFGELDPDVRNAFRAAAARHAGPADESTARELRAAFEPALASYNVISTVEAWEVHQSWAERHASDYDPNVWQRLTRVRQLSIDDRRDADAAAQRLRETWAAYFREFDFLILPATPCAALRKADCTPANRARLLGLGAPASVGGLPVLTIPVPLPGGLTSGLQVVARDVGSGVFDAILSAVEKESTRHVAQH